MGDERRFIRRTTGGLRGRVLLAVLVAGAALLPAAAVAGGFEVRTVADSGAPPDAGLGRDDRLWLLDGVGANGTPGLNGSLSGDVLEEAGDPARLATGAGPLAELPSGPLGIPGIALQGYRHAESALAKLRPACHLPWSLPAAIGRIESGHARGGRAGADGTTAARILGPVLDGTHATANIADTDRGRLDGDVRHDRAVGPMQFIPSTWRRFGADGNADGAANPNNIYDAAVATGKLLCSAGENLADPRARARAVFGYNHSDSYVRNVLIWAAAYDAGVRPVDVAASAAGVPPLSAPHPPAPDPPASHPATPKPGRPAGHQPAGSPPGTPPPNSAPSSTAPPGTAPPGTSTSPSCPPLPPTPTAVPGSSAPPATSTPPSSVQPGCPSPTPTPSVPSPPPAPSTPPKSPMSRAPSAAG